MAEQRDQQELEELVEAQARGEESEAEVPTEPEAPPERKLDRRRSKQWFQSPAGQVVPGSGG